MISLLTVACEGLAKLVKDSEQNWSEKELIEKGFQPGRRFLKKTDTLVISAIVDAMDEK